MGGDGVGEGGWGGGGLSVPKARKPVEIDSVNFARAEYGRA